MIKFYWRTCKRIYAGLFRSSISLSLKLAFYMLITCCSPCLFVPCANILHPFHCDAFPGGWPAYFLHLLFFFFHLHEFVLLRVFFLHQSLYDYHLKSCW